jgi:hypothetical protein
MLLVPIQPLPNQTLQVQLDGQACTLNIYQQAYGLYMDVLVNGTQIIGGVLCENLNRIVRSLYLGFLGDFLFVDLQGSSDPVYTGLGTQFALIYLEQSDLPANVG